MKRMMVKKIQSCLIILVAITVLFIFNACSPVTHQAIEEVPVDIVEDSSVMNDAASNGRSITLSFFPVSGARSYAVTLDGINDDPEPLSTAFSGGMYTATIALEDLKTRSASTSVTGTLYASPEISASDYGWKKVTDFEAEYRRASIDDFAPDCKVDERTENSVVIEILNQAEPDMEYKVTMDNGFEKEYSSTPITIDGLSSTETYQATIAHRFKDTEEWGSMTATLAIGAFEGEKVLGIEAASDTGDITITNIPSDAVTLELVKDSTGRVAASVTLDGSSSYTFSAKDTFPVFDIGLFKAKAIGADRTVISDSIPYASPIADAVKTPGRQHYKVTFPVAEDVSMSNPSVDIDGASVDMSVTGGEAAIGISGLESLSQYDATLTVTSDSNSISIPLSFKTESFAGYYEFTDSEATGSYMNKFSVVVEANTKDSSDEIKYYVYSNEGDGRNRIMPLIDGEVEQGTRIKYKGDTAYQKAYQWNNGKWNTMAAFISPSEWEISDFQILARDTFRTTTTSYVGTLDTVTVTEFSFVEDESNKPSIVFFNKITNNDFYNGFLKKNRMSEDQGFADKGADAPYYFLLKYEGALTK